MEHHEEAHAFLESFYTRTTPRDGRHLEAMTRLLHIFNIELEQFAFVQITGSCGKGSTAAFISSILENAEVDHGLFTGPHLIDYEERFIHNNNQITRSDFDRIVLMIKNKLIEQQDLENVGHMHLVILIALIWFQENHVNLVIFENGVGGASDPSNIFNPLVACLTEITLDHTHLLGNTIEQITIDKSAIIKQETKSVVCGMLNETARTTLMQQEMESGQHYQFIQRDFTFIVNNLSFSYKSEELEIQDLVPSLPGIHQFQNATVAICVIEGLIAHGYKIGKSAIRHGIENTQWPGRLERFNQAGNTIFLDGAHNPFELQTLNKSLNILNLDPKVILISFASRKNIKEMLEALRLPDALYIAVPSPFLERRQSKATVTETLQALHLKFIYLDEVEEALAFAQKSLKEDEMLLVTGSLYLVGEVRRLLLNKEVTL